MQPGSKPRAAAALMLAAIAAGFVALAAPGAGRRGLVAEEIQPYLERYPHVLERARDQLALMPPYDPGAPTAPRWVATPQWPVLAWDSGARIWPVLIRGHQSALGAYPGLSVGPLLGGGVAGVRRSSVLLGLAIVLLTWATAQRSRGAPTLAAFVVAASLGTVWLSGTGYGFELASRAFMMAALALAAPLRPPTMRRAFAIGAATGLALVARATVGAALLPALAILLAHPTRRARTGPSAAIAAMALAIPLGLLAAVAAVGLRAGTAPLAGLPLGSLGARTAGLAAQLALQLGFVGDANVVLGPLARGEAHLGVLGPFALAAAIPVVAAVARWWRGTSADGERMLVSAMLGSVIAGAWLYDGPNQFQLALALEPLWALAVAEQLVALRALRPRLGLAALGLVFALRAEALARGLPSLAAPGNPMLSGRAQHAAVARLRALGVAGPELVTTTYNHAGVLEAWTGGAVRPLHAWPVLARGSGATAAAPGLEATWREILRDFHPRYVLLSEGTNLYDGPFTDNDAIAASLARAAAGAGLSLDVDARFPTERGTPGWSLVRVGGASVTDRSAPTSGALGTPSAL